MACTRLEEELDDLRKAGLAGLREGTPRFFEGARQGLAVLGLAAAELDRHLARRFSVFNYVRHENLMSDVLADLVRPDSVHGQGDLFLSAFLKDLRKDKATQAGMSRLGLLPDGASPSQVRVVREAHTTHIESEKRRVDIEISMRVGEGPERVAIAIENKPKENKPKKGDQPKQLSDYAEHLDKKYEGRYLLLYLTPKGSTPDPGSIGPDRRKQLEKQGRFACVSLTKWAQGWMREAEHQVQAAYVQRFVADFRQAVLRKDTDPGTEPDPEALLGQVAS